MNEKKILLVFTALLVCLGVSIDLDFIRIKSRFITENAPWFAPLGYALYVGYDLFSSKKK